MAKPEKKSEAAKADELPESDAATAAVELGALPEDTSTDEGDPDAPLEDILPDEDDGEESDTGYTPLSSLPTLAGSLSGDDTWPLTGESPLLGGSSYASDYLSPIGEAAPEPTGSYYEMTDFGATKPGLSLDGASRPDFTHHEVKVPTPAHYVSGGGSKINGSKTAEIIEGSDEGDVIKSHKGDDSVSGYDGDDLLRGGHGDDLLDGGAGNDSVNGGKGDDVIDYTLSENLGNTDYYDGGKGSDTLRLNLTVEEYAEHEAELAELETWIADNANPKASQSQAFNDASSNSAKHPVFETSWGLNIRNVESLEINITSEEPAPEPEPVVEPVVEPEPEAEAEAEAVVVDLAASATTEAAPSTVITSSSGTGSLPIDSMSVTLSADSVINVSMDVNVNELPPIYDVFMLHDLSGSFYDDLPNVQANFSSLYDGLTASSDVQFGVGSFVDKPVSPFGMEGGDYSYTLEDGSTYTYSYRSDWVYNTDLGITGDKEALQDSLDGLSIYSGSDWKEAQLEALAQTALRDEEIGFRDGAQKFVILQTDAAYHEEGDYYWASEGANNLDTVLGDEDYPSVTAVGDLLQAAGITPIFAVANPYPDSSWDTANVYQELVDIWGFGYVTEITSDSSNIVAAINDGLTSVPLSLDMSVNGDDYGYVSSVTPTLYEDIGPGTYSFDITLEIPSDSTSYSSDSLTLDVTGYGSINVEVEIARLDATGDSGNDTLLGTAGSNGLYGLAGDDILDGRGGDDIIVGGPGSDTLRGGEGSDLFLYSVGDTTGTDIIKDFQASVGGDVLDFSALFASFDTTTDPVSDFLNFLESDGDTTVQVDIDGGGDSFVDIATLEGVTGINVDTMMSDGGIIV